MVVSVGGVGRRRRKGTPRSTLFIVPTNSSEGMLSTARQPHYRFLPRHYHQMMHGRPFGGGVPVFYTQAAQAGKARPPAEPSAAAASFGPLREHSDFDDGR